MGNGLARLAYCCPGDGAPTGRRRRRHGAVAVTWDPCDEGLGHSFCYVRRDTECGVSGRPYAAAAAASTATASSKVHHSEETTTFRTISGAAVSANAWTPLSTSLLDVAGPIAASAFESSTSFSSVALQPVPRFSGPLSGPLAAADRGFMSGPIERGFMSGPLDHRASLFSAPLDKPLCFSDQLRRSLSHGLPRPRRMAVRSLIRGLTKAVARTVSTASYGSGSIVAPVKGPKDSGLADGGLTNLSGSSGRHSVEAAQWSDSLDSLNGNLQWAQGKAGEDRVHVVVSEEHGWVFVGIYDGFNGPDATDYLLSNLYPAVHRELKGLLWEDKNDTFCREPVDDPTTPAAPDEHNPTVATNWAADDRSSKEGRENKRKPVGAARKWEENHRRWRCEFERERLELDRRLKEQSMRSSQDRSVNHSLVLEALSEALRKTEESFLDIADKMVSENPELALMGSCVLVMLMKGDDVYLMNVGDSRAIVARKAEPESWSSVGKPRKDLERINEETLFELDANGGGGPSGEPTNLVALQLNSDHSTSVEEEVGRIRDEHPDDSSAIWNDRVKGSLKVTRAFGAGFLKQPKWNDGLLEMFRIEYVGSTPYITCNPSLHHHKLGPKDAFLILSSDGLYQYFTNQEAVAQVQMFVAATPEGDPAQHLVEQVLFRAAKKAGMDFHELLEIPQGDRRRYHDDICVIIISLEGRIWRSCSEVVVV
ncbi:probable protein phosphatase 2C 4 isoform X1 [Musa acuminata AAA Group]|uniref:probable protein phosphatase 2C 4 isoform X1 n=1 Tax=Musa acuminata AAA Group TaxID=214697 RepID=UPI0031D7B6C2